MPGIYRSLPPGPSEPPPTTLAKKLRDLTRRKSRALAPALAALACLGLIWSVYSYSNTSIRGWSGSFDELRRGWVTSFVREEPGVHRAVPAVTSNRLFSDACAELWIAQGMLCDELEGTGGEVVDVVYTWTNGSDPFLRRWREFISERVGAIGFRLNAKVEGAVGAGSPGNSYRAQKQFRDHDELRYSIRSVLAAFGANSIRNIFLVSTDLPFETLPSALLTNDLSFQSRILSPKISTLVPTWFNQSLLDPNTTDVSPPHFRLVSHSSIFPASSKGGQHDWLDGMLPTFNSMAIESRLFAIEGVSEHFLYLNDDLLLTGAFTSSDVGSTLFGPVFRIQRNLGVDGVAPEDVTGRLNSEWPGLKLSNWLLDRRFGRAQRGYLAHNAKALSRPLLREVSYIWQSELDQTAQSRFRGQHLEYSLPFLATHYIIERHREALLWSFFVARADLDRDGFLSLLERQSLVDDLGFATDHNPSDDLVGYVPVRSTHDDSASIHERTGIPLPGVTHVGFDSRDGFRGYERGPHLLPGSEACKYEGSLCLGTDFLDPERIIKSTEAFTRNAFEHRECGNCVIQILVGRTGKRGLAAFLPRKAKVDDSQTTSPLPPYESHTLGTEKDWKSVDFALPRNSGSLQLRRDTVRLIQRYSYSLGESNSSLITMTSLGSTIVTLSRLDEEFAKLTHTFIDSKQRREKQNTSFPAFLALNDDLVAVSERQGMKFDGVLGEFMELRWSEASQFERWEVRERGPENGEKPHWELAA